MTIHLLCFTSTGGLPIFSRKRGDCESFPFSTIASLNGVYMFCKSQGINLKNTFMEDGIVIWKEYEDCITMIGAAKGVTEKVLSDLLDLAFNAMIVCVSLNEIRHMKNVEHLKRELKLHCYAMIDKLLDYADNDLLRFTDCMITNDGQLILTKLNEFSELVGSPFCCVLARQKVIVATEGWWDLDTIDRKLLIALLSSTSLTRPDVPVFLPRKNPNIAYRLVSVMLCPNVSVCVLCGAEPSYNGIENIGQQIWRMDLAVLENAELCYPKNFPANLQLAQGILGIILINKNQHKYIMSRNLQQSTTGKRSSSGAHRLDILRTFFHQSVDVIDDDKIETELSADTSSSTDELKSIDDTQSNALTIKCLESYWCSDYHKCHSYRLDDNIICILYVSSIPTHTMRLMTQKTLNSILSEKDIVW